MLSWGNFLRTAPRWGPASSSLASGGAVSSVFALSRRMTFSTTEPDSAFAAALEKVQKKQKIHLRERDVRGILKLVTTHEDFEEARNLFEEVRRRLADFSPAVYKDLVEAGHRIGNSSIPLQILTLPANARLYPPEGALIRLLRQLYLKKDFEAVEQLESAVKRNGYQVSEPYFNEHIHWSRRFGRDDKIKGYYEDLERLANNRLGRTNAITEYLAFLAANKEWQAILDTGRKVLPKGSTIRYQVVAALNLGDKALTKQILEAPESARRNALGKPTEFMKHPEIFPLLQEVLQEIVDEGKTEYGEAAELMLLRVQLALQNQGSSEEPAASGSSTTAE